ncbi:endonuclease/exonuclease/phosphatase family protein, partial [Acidovorax sp. ST3]|uniref:endonuclease/exonuclease/phosphatase family protein n=1 Tax=Acidovorax sp. ST3 TaxID=2219062 RepID=UPI00193E404C
MRPGFSFRGGILYAGVMRLRLATWNVNSVKIRVENTLAWLKERDPDIVCLQELKCVDEAFPREAFESARYNVAIHGQKTYNGVAILSKLPLEDVTPRL